MMRRCALGTLGAAGIVLLLAGCSRNATTEAEDAARARAREDSLVPASPPQYTIGVGDTVSVKFSLNSEFDSQLPVRPDGRFAMPLLGDVDVAGTTPEALHQRLVESYRKYLKHPELTVNVVTFGSTAAYVGGEVRNPGVVSIAVPTTALRAIIAVGGGLTSGDLRRVVIVRDQGTREPRLLMLDLSRGLETLESPEDAWLRPKDIVFVPRTGISEANQFVREYIRNLLPIESSFSLQYQFTNIPGAH
jgi:protein involved in polysaccharide export with SLBB domain